MVLKMIKINQTVIDKKDLTTKEIELCQEFVKQNQVFSKGESFHALLTLEEDFMYVCNVKDDMTLPLALGTYEGLIPLDIKESQDVIKPEDVKIFLEKGKNLYLFKITQTDGLINSIDIVTILEDEEHLQLVDTTQYTGKRANRILATFGMDYFKYVLTAEDLGLSESCSS